MEEAFWKGKRVLVTGYEGFLGSHLTKRLLRYGARVSGLDVNVNRKHTILEASDYQQLRVIKGSVESYRLVSSILAEDGIEVIFHLAAQALVGVSFQHPCRTFSSNIRGTWNVLEAAREHGGIESIVVASSDKAYGVHSVLPYQEDAPLAGCYPYDVSKSCADLLAHSYAASYNMPVSITRCGNIFGPGDFHFSRIVPDTIRSAVQDAELVIRSDGTFTRDYIYVDDVVSGYLLLAEKMRQCGLKGEAFNLSDENPISVLELVETIYRLAKRTPAYRIANIARCEIPNQYLSAAKARRLLGFQPQHTLEQGLVESIAWYKAYFAQRVQLS